MEILGTPAVDLGLSTEAEIILIVVVTLVYIIYRSRKKIVTYFKHIVGQSNEDEDSSSL